MSFPHCAIGRHVTFVGLELLELEAASVYCCSHGGQAQLFALAPSLSLQHETVGNEAS